MFQLLRLDRFSRLVFTGEGRGSNYFLYCHFVRDELSTACLGISVASLGHPSIFPEKKLATTMTVSAILHCYRCLLSPENWRPFLFITVTLYWFHYGVPAGCQPALFYRPRFSTTLCKFAHNFFPFGCHPLEGFTQGGPPAPLVTPMIPYLSMLIIRLFFCYITAGSNIYLSTYDVSMQNVVMNSKCWTPTVTTWYYDPVRCHVTFYSTLTTLLPLWSTLQYQL